MSDRVNRFIHNDPAGADQFREAVMRLIVIGIAIIAVLALIVETIHSMVFNEEVDRILGNRDY